ncbi:MAG: SRPBCC domain-containing protein [Tagaea sp.]|nr:SRPBCC domain-containing protein [Tagaea sp.]
MPARASPKAAKAVDAVAISVAREFDAPPHRLFRWWVEPRHFIRWFGPARTDMPVCELEGRAGGMIRFCTRFDDGREIWVKGRFREVREPDRLVFPLWFTDEQGRPASHPGYEDWPLDVTFVTTVAFQDIGHRGKIVVHQAVRPSSAARHPNLRAEREIAKKGWAESLDRLADLLADAD